jgi:hypothetical protein
VNTLDLVVGRGAARHRLRANASPSHGFARRDQAFRALGMMASRRHVLFEARVIHEQGGGQTNSVAWHDFVQRFARTRWNSTRMLPRVAGE